MFINHPEPPEHNTGGDGNQGQHLLTPSFFTLMYNILSSNGTLTIVTDNLPYAKLLVSILQQLASEGSEGGSGGRSESEGMSRGCFESILLPTSGGDERQLEYVVQLPYRDSSVSETVMIKNRATDPTNVLEDNNSSSSAIHTVQIPHTDSPCPTTTSTNASVSHPIKPSEVSNTHKSTDGDSGSDSDSDSDIEFTPLPLKKGPSRSITTTTAVAASSLSRTSNGIRAIVKKHAGTISGLVNPDAIDSDLLVENSHNIKAAEAKSTISVLATTNNSGHNNSHHDKNGSSASSSTNRSSSSSSSVIQLWRGDQLGDVGHLSAASSYFGELWYIFTCVYI